MFPSDRFNSGERGNWIRIQSNQMLESSLACIHQLTVWSRPYQKLYRFPIQYEPPVAPYSLTAFLYVRTGKETKQLNHQAKHILYPCFTDTALSSSLRRDDLAKKNQLIQSDKHLLDPCDGSGAPLLKSYQEAKRKWPYPKGGLNPEDGRDASNFQARGWMNII